MRRMLFGILLTTLLASGCAFNRADFVAGPDGKADQSQMSDSGRTVGPIVGGLMGGRISTSTSY
jgi:hypothetical protein